MGKGGKGPARGFPHLHPSISPPPISTTFTMLMEFSSGGGGGSFGLQDKGGSPSLVLFPLSLTRGGDAKMGKPPTQTRGIPNVACK